MLLSRAIDDVVASVGADLIKRMLSPLAILTIKICPRFFAPPEPAASLSSPNLGAIAAECRATLRRKMRGKTFRTNNEM